MHLELMTSPFNNFSTGKTVNCQLLVTACHVGKLLKDEVLGSRHINNIIMELVRTHKEGVGIDAL